MTKVLVSGCKGAMGKILCRLISEKEGWTVNIGFDKIPGSEEFDFPVVTDVNAIPNINNWRSDVIIDFSAPEATSKILDFAYEYERPIVIATTGINDLQKKINDYSKKIPIFQSANMSYGIFVTQKLVEVAAYILRGYHPEILEAHHTNKKDAPSGTAYMLANTIKEYSEAKSTVYGRTGKRKYNEIGIASLRGGKETGEHSVFFFGEYDKISITHTAYSKEVFAVGAIEAAEFLLIKEPGIYSLEDFHPLEF